MPRIQNEEGFISLVLFINDITLQYQVQSDSDTDSDKRDRYHDLHPEDPLKHK